jgi:hypothetical protein
MPLDLLTRYTYDGFGDLQNVTQTGKAGENARIRTFTYDALSRLLTSRNSETGPTCYGQWSGSSCASGYDGDNNLHYRSDARGVVANYSFDSLNRIIAVNYLNDPTGSSSFCYQFDAPTTANGIGRLSVQWTQKGTCPPSPGGGELTKTSIAAYDAVGRVRSEQQCVLSVCSLDYPGKFTYNYDLTGKLSYYGDGLGTTLFTNQFDSNGRLLTVSSSWVDQTHPATLFSAQSYNPAGGLTTALYGVNTQNVPAITLGRTYDPRFRILSETDIGAIVQAIATPGTATTAVTGTEQANETK